MVAWRDLNGELRSTSGTRSALMGNDKHIQQALYRKEYDSFLASNQDDKEHPVHYGKVGSFPTFLLSSSPIIIPYT